MTERFGAFTLVDRITELEAGKRARGRFALPADVSHFPASLSAEAAGQLAAWVAMSSLDFRVRPVAGLAAELRFKADVHPGETLDLEVEIESCDADAVSYSARADVGERRVIELEHSVGPMLPMEEFDSPDAVRERFELLCGPGARSGRFRGVPKHEMDVVEEVGGERMRAMLHVPKEAAFFADHFPRRPVFPATLLLDAQIVVALKVAAGSTHWPAGAQLAASRMPDIKMRSFISPGELVELQIDLEPPGEDGASMARTAARVNGKLVATGRLEIIVRRSA